MCVRACVRVCVRACVCVCVRLHDRTKEMFGFSVINFKFDELSYANFSKLLHTHSECGGDKVSEIATSIAQFRTILPSSSCHKQ